MKRIMFIIATLAIIFGLSMNCLAYTYVSSGLSARIMGLSYTFTGIANEPTTLYWNPGGVTRTKGLSFTFLNPYNIPDYQVLNFNMVESFNINGFNTGIGLAFSRDTGKVYDDSGNTNIEESRFGVGIGVGLAQGAFNIGYTGWLSQLIAGEINTRDTSFDLGCLWCIKNTKIGLAVRNLGAIAPLETTLGVSYLVPFKNFLDGLVLALDLTSFKYDGKVDFHWNAGIETIIYGVALRVGSNTVNPFNSFGIGFTKGSWKFDYALNLHKLGKVHYFTLGYNL